MTNCTDKYSCENDYLAPIEVKILLWRGSPQKIATDNGISFLKITIKNEEME
ncbi:MAG: hypothetical protein ABI576_00240 [Flavobacterium sp.]